MLDCDCMSGNENDSDRSIDLANLKKKWLKMLIEIGDKLGFVASPEVATNGGRVDFVWFYDLKTEIPNLGNKLPVIGFEIETSWRTRKHIKGDIFNLLGLSPSCGVILFLSEGFNDDSELRGNIEAAKKYVSGISGVCRILVWTEKNLLEISDELNKNLSRKA